MSLLSEEKRRLVREVFEKTGSIRATAKQTGVSRNTVRRQLRANKNAGSKIRQTSTKSSKLDCFKSKIDFLVREKDLSGVRIMEEIQELGYQGGYTILKNYLRKVRPKPRRRPTPPIDHAPGHEGQMDWSPHKVILGGREQVVQTGSIVLCFSRWAFIRFFTDQSIEKVISLHEQAFHELGAVPKTMTYDNMTTVGRYVGSGEVWINPTFKRFAEEYGFEVVILLPGKKERHGIVERPFHYIENNFLKGREFRDMEDLNNRSDLWRAQKANVRIHGTLREKPMDRLAREMTYLKRLPPHVSNDFSQEVDRKVHPDFCVSLDTNRYSVDPDLIEEWVKVRLYREHLEIWFNKQLHCRHIYALDRNERKILPEHEEKYKKMSGQKQLLEQAFLRLGEAARTYYQGLKKEKKGAAGYQLQRILRYVDRYGRDTVLGALNHAMSYEAYSADAIFRIIKGKKLKPQQNNPTMPENTRNWLKAQAVEKQSLGDYDKLIKGLDHEDENDG